MTGHYARVSKQMVQMFGPQWTEKFGPKNDAWDEGLKGLTYQQIGIGLAKVMKGALKFYEIDLPRFFELCKPPPAPVRPEAMTRPDWMEGMSEAEIQMNCYANKKMLVWCCRHKKFGLDARENFSKQQNDQLWEAARKISRVFFLMREELGTESVPDEDFLKALHRGWSRIAPEE
jgi:hypothetical protein